jgi:hypothetical protein
MDFAQTLWLITFLEQLVLLGILIGRKRVVRFPFFTTYIAFVIAQTVINFGVYRFASKGVYFWVYWSLALVDVMAQLGVVYEMAREVLRPTGTWSRDARVIFLILGSVGAVLAAGLSFAVNPKATSGLFAWTVRLDLFASLLIAELVIAMFLAASRVGLHWRNWVMGLAEGLGLWVGLSLCVETAHSYFGWTRQYATFDELVTVAYMVALARWCVSFWRTEPERKPMSPEMHKYLVTLADSLDYDRSRLRSEGRSK